MRMFGYRFFTSTVIALCLLAGGASVRAAEKTAKFKLYSLSLQFSLSSLFSDNGNLQQWGFTTAGSTNAPLGYSNGLLSTEVSPTSRNFSAGSNTFRTDFIVYDYTTGITRVAGYGLMTMVLPTTDRSGPWGGPDGVPDLFQKEVGFQYTARATAKERFNWAGNLRSGTVNVLMNRPQGTNVGNYQLRYGSVNNPIVVNGSMRTLQTGGTVIYDAATRMFRLEFDNGMVADSVFTNLSTALVSVPGFTVPDPDGPDYQAKNLSLSRKGKTYRGLWEFHDGNTATPYRDVPYSYLVIRDTNDSDGDGIPDLSDPFIAPTIKSHPVSKTVPSGTSVTFSGSATGYPYVSYQWQRNGEPIPGATRSSLTLNSVQVSQAGNYRLRAFNPGGSELSSVAQLIVCDYSFSPSVPTFPAGGGSINVEVTTSGGCDWNLVNTNGWVQPNVTSGSGSTFINVTVLANTNENARLGFLKIGHRFLPIRQFGQLPPAAFAGKTLLLTVTNSTGELTNDSKLRLWTSAATNVYQAIALSGATPLQQGIFTYSRTSDATATLSLGDVSEGFTIQLSFTSPNAGSFNLAGDHGTQAGTFELNANRADFNADRLDDLLWQNKNRVLWSSVMNGTNTLEKLRLRNGTAPGTGWRVFGVADINRDDCADILLQHDTGKIQVWFMAGTNLMAVAPLRTASSGWRAVAVADFNRDDSPDFVFQHTTRKSAVWYMQGTNFVSSAPIRQGAAAGTGWRIVGVSDFSDDGEPDVLWQHDDGRLAPWHLVGTTFLSSSLLRNGQALNGWRVVSLNDLNNDGKADLLFQNGSKLVAWFMRNEEFLGSAPLPATLVGGPILGPR